jgi:hypothetical protein
MKLGSRDLIMDGLKMPEEGAAVPGPKEAILLSI